MNTNEQQPTCSEYEKNLTVLIDSMMPAMDFSQDITKIKEELIHGFMCKWKELQNNQPVFGAVSPTLNEQFGLQFTTVLDSFDVMPPAFVTHVEHLAQAQLARLDTMARIFNHIETNSAEITPRTRTHVMHLLRGEVKTSCIMLEEHRCPNAVIRDAIVKLIAVVQDRIYSGSFELENATSQLRRQLWNEATDTAKNLVDQYY